MTLPAGSFTGIGSMPGTDVAETARLVFGEAGLPFLPELPARGAGADMIGRAAALLVDLPVEIVPSGWRLTAHPGRDLRRARDFLAWDLDALEVAGAEYTGPVKLQVAGPWTLAALLELPSGHRVVSDHGATRELVQSLREAVRDHLAAVAARLPGASLVLQLDEPSLPAALAGQVPTPSGYGAVAAVESETVGTALASVLEVADATVVHCCAADAPVGLIAAAGAGALSLDATLPHDLDAIGEAHDAGLALWLGVIPGADVGVADAGGADASGAVSLDSARTALRRITDPLGLTGRERAEVVVTPVCGLAGATAAYARRAFGVLGDLARWLADAD